MNKILFLYIAAVLLTTIFSYLFVDSNLIYFNALYTGIYTQHREVVSLVYFMLLSLFFILYFFVLKISEITNKLLARVIAICSFLFFSNPSVFSYDIYNYILTSKLTFFYKENPYVIMPNELIGEPYLTFTRATNKIALYGPMWIIISFIAYALGVGNFILTLFSFKLIVVGFFMATIFLMQKNIKSNHQIALFALNPLVLFEIFISGHNDIVMMFFAIVAMLLILKRKISIAILMLLISILIKFSTVFLIPVFIYVAYCRITNKKMNLENVFLFAALSMFIIFLLSFIREEIYPWYAIWFLSFLPFVSKNKYVHIFAGLLSFGLMLRYIPFMATGSYFGNTPMLKIILTIVPLIIGGVFLLVKKYETKN